MEVHRQTCQACKSRKLKNLLVRQPGERDMVFVQCHDCKSLVARYIVGSNGYYHHGKEFESYLRSLTRGGAEIMSGKNMKKDFEMVGSESLEKFEKVLRWLAEHNKSDS